MKPLHLALVLALACMVAWPPALRAQDSSPTLDKIREAGVISLGYRESSIPFSYLNDAQRPIGYSMAICDRIVDAVIARLGVHDIERRYVAVTSATRIPLIANGNIDLECGVTTHTLERDKQVAFTITTFVAESRLVSKKSAPVMRIDDMRGKIVTSTVGTTSLAHLQDLYANQGLDMTILAAKDDPDAFRLVANDRAAAYAMDDVLLRGTVATSPHPEDYVISSESLSVEPYGIMMRRGDAVFKHLADQAIAGMFRSGEMTRLYRQWFQAPIPPRGINLGLPLYPSMQKVMDHPTDSADPSVYR